jgi:hypothetical protein
MSSTTTTELAREVRRAGYQVIAAEQLRPNRWLLQVTDAEGLGALLMVQARPLVGAADVQDLAELVRLRRPHYGILLARRGSFSPAAQRTLAELGDHRLRLCTALPPTSRGDAPDQRAVGAPLKSPS